MEVEELLGETGHGRLMSLSGMFMFWLGAGIPWLFVFLLGNVDFLGDIISFWMFIILFVSAIVIFLIFRRTRVLSLGMILGLVAVLYLTTNSMHSAYGGYDVLFP